MESQRAFASCLERSIVFERGSLKRTSEFQRRNLHIDTVVRVAGRRRLAARTRTTANSRCPTTRTPARSRSSTPASFLATLQNRSPFVSLCVGKKKKSESKLVLNTQSAFLSSKARARKGTLAGVAYIPSERFEGGEWAEAGGWRRPRRTARVRAAARRRVTGPRPATVYLGFESCKFERGRDG